MSPDAGASVFRRSRVAAKSERDWIRPIGFGFLLTFASAPGQTFFVSLSAGAIRSEFGLAHLDFSALYTGATVVSAVSMLGLGGLADRPKVVRTALWTLASLGAACMLMAGAFHVVALGIALVALRISGQGMLGHIAMTALGRSFDAARGRALALASLGFPFAEGLLPSVVAWGLASTSWRVVWLCAGGALLGLVAPLVWGLGRWRLNAPAEPSSTFARRGTAGSSRGRATINLGRGRTRREVLRDPRFYIALPAVMLPAFVMTGVFFHQVHLAETRGWSLAQLAQLYPGYAIAATLSTFGAGWLVDRTSAWTLLTVSLVPLAGGLAMLGGSDTLSGAGWFFALAGVTMGCASILQGTLWPELYGTERLGDVRSLAVAGLVLSTAAAPVMLGAGLDAGLAIDHALQAMLTIVVIAVLGLTLGSWVPPFARCLWSKR